MRTHKHADLADSSAALIADLNRPGDLSLSLTYTLHTSFFFFSSLHPLPQTLPPAQISILPVSLCITLLLPPPSSLETTPRLARHDHR